MPDNPTPESAARDLLVEALKGRTASPGDILNLDVSTFVVGDTVNASAVNRWVAEHSTARAKDEIPARFRAQHEAGGDAGREEAERRFGTR